ncbi:MAG: hypothetical protein KBD85_04450 [Elusimicrobia bacterium]|nr:hypothetical protein [Elusimicrobiota bacterium]
MRSVFSKGFLMCWLVLMSLVSMARAMPLEVGPFGGWRFGGSFDDAWGQSHTADASGSFGGLMDIYFGPDSALEILFSRQESSFQGDTFASIPFNYTMDHYQIGGLKEYREGKFRPFLAGLLGLTHVKTKSESDDFFSFTLDGGAKYYLTSWLGFRTDLRCYLMFTNGAVAASSGPSGGSVSYSGDVFVQGEVAGAAFLAFGGAREQSEDEKALQEFRRRNSVPQ